MEDIELVQKHCKHRDCIYRRRFDLQGTEYCAYIVMAKRPRGCRISECDKYALGDAHPAINAKTMEMEWEIEIWQK